MVEYTSIILKSQVFNRGIFYNEYSGSKITFLFNPQVNLSKNFQTINYEGDSGWQVDSFTSDKQGPEYSNPWGEWGNG